MFCLLPLFDTNWSDVSIIFIVESKKTIHRWSVMCFLCLYMSRFTHTCFLQKPCIGTFCNCLKNCHILPTGQRYSSAELLNFSSPAMPNIVATCDTLVSKFSQNYNMVVQIFIKLPPSGSKVHGHQGRVGEKIQSQKLKSKTTFRWKICVQMTRI